MERKNKEQEGTLEDAIAEACSVNREHDKSGLARTNADKRLAVETLLSLEKWKNKSTRLVAEYCRVTQRFVSEVKNQLRTVLSFPERVIGKDGKEHSAQQKRKSKEPACEPAIGFEPEAPDEQEESEPKTVYAFKSESQYTNGKDLKSYYTVPQWEAQPAT